VDVNEDGPLQLNTEFVTLLLADRKIVYVSHTGELLVSVGAGGMLLTETDVIAIGPEQPLTVTYTV
jgi:hypothetical protein